MDMEGDVSVTEKELRIYLQRYTALGNWRNGRGDVEADEAKVKKMIEEVDQMVNNNSKMEE